MQRSVKPKSAPRPVERRTVVGRVGGMIDGRGLRMLKCRRVKVVAPMLAPTKEPLWTARVRTWVVRMRWW